MAMKRVFGVLLGALLCWNTLAENIELTPSHPDRYVVVKGDTLWDISARFLKTPWRWPDIWHVNEQIENPHLIYPGDIVELSFVDGQPRLSVNRGNGKLSPRIRRSSMDDAIPMIPISTISAFLNKPRVMTEGEYDSAPYVIAFADEHILGSEGYKAYIKGLDEGTAGGYTVVRQGEEYLDGTTGESLGFESIFIAESELVAQAEIATVMLSKTRREARKEDRLLPAEEGAILQNYYPHEPNQDIRGRIIGVFNGVSQVAKYDVVVIDRGLRDGVEEGHVLQIDHAGETVRDRIAGGSSTVVLPDEKAGVLMVFRVFERVSYGLVMESTRVMHRHDVVRTP